MERAREGIDFAFVLWKKKKKGDTCALMCLACPVQIGPAKRYKEHTSNVLCITEKAFYYLNFFCFVF